MPARKANDAAHHAIRRGIAILFRALFQEGSGTDAIEEQAVNLTKQIQQNFCHVATGSAVTNAETMSRIEQILRFVQTHWAEPVTLAQIASMQYLR